MIEVTIYEDERGNPSVSVKETNVVKPEDIAKIYKAIKKELERKDK